MTEVVFGESEIHRAKKILYMIYENAKDTRDIEGAHLEPQTHLYARPSKGDFEWVKVFGKGKRRLLRSDDYVSLNILYVKPEIIVERMYWPYGSKTFKTEVLYKKHILIATEESIAHQVVTFLKNYFRDLNSKGLWGGLTQIPCRK